MKLFSSKWIPQLLSLLGLLIRYFLSVVSLTSINLQYFLTSEEAKVRNLRAIRFDVFMACSFKLWPSVLAFEGRLHLYCHS